MSNQNSENTHTCDQSGEPNPTCTPCQEIIIARMVNQCFAPHRNDPDDDPRLLSAERYS